MGAKIEHADEKDASVETEIGVATSSFSASIDSASIEAT